MTRRPCLLSTLAGLAGIAAWLGTAVPGTVVAAQTCNAGASASATSGAFAPMVVELYTSEGCNSCPPADRWLSRLDADNNDVVALAFHVDYWDRLGWKDRFASPAHTQRQAQTQASSGARFSYTPQVIVDGADRPDWSRTPLAGRARAPARVDVRLERDGNRFSATVSPAARSPARLAAYWAVTEQGHVSAVQAGENSGVTLKHDHVVRDYQPVAPWAPQPSATTTLRFETRVPVDRAHPRSTALVIVDADTGRPVQAVRLGC